MRFSSKTLREAIYYIIPSFRVAVKGGSNLNLPMMVEKAAIAFFIRDEGSSSPLDYYMAEIIVRNAMRDLQTGECIFKFGDREHEFTTTIQDFDNERNNPTI